jgi:hypothetical protein
MRAGALAKRKIGRPRLVDNSAPGRMPWESDRFARQVREILASVEAPPVDAQVGLTLQKHLYRSEIFGTDGRGHITLLLRTILESENNGDALIEPIVSAVSSCMRPEWTGLGLEWIEAFDQIPLTAILETVRALFGEQDLWSHYCLALRRKIARILEPAKAKPGKPAKVKAKPKPPLSLSRVPAIVKRIELGVALLALRASMPSNAQFGREVHMRFPGVDQITASEAMKVARTYGTRPEIYRRLSWIALFELSSPKMAPSVRQALEAKILAGQSITALQIRRARGRLRGGRPKRRLNNQPASMAA